MRRIWTTTGTHWPKDQFQISRLNAAYGSTRRGKGYQGFAFSIIKSTAILVDIVEAVSTNAKYVTPAFRTTLYNVVRDLEGGNKRVRKIRCEEEGGVTIDITLVNTDGEYV